MELKPQPGQEGEQLGFVNEVVPHEQTLDRAIEVANEILACSPLSIRASGHR